MKVKVEVAHLCPALCDPMDWLHSPWNSPGQNTEVGNLSFFQGIFPTQGSNVPVAALNVLQIRTHNKPMHKEVFFSHCIGHKTKAQGITSVRSRASRQTQGSWCPEHTETTNSATLFLNFHFNLTDFVIWVSYVLYICMYAFL